MQEVVKFEFGEKEVEEVEADEELVSSVYQTPPYVIPEGTIDEVGSPFWRPSFLNIVTEAKIRLEQSLRIFFLMCNTS